ncbi:MAG: hypothetical protein ACYDHY_07745 [Acidiferrobacterales bacterium]
MFLRTPLPEFFHELVSEAPSAKRLSQTSRFYLESLLVEMVRRAPDLDRPICLRILGPITPNRPVVLKEAGDAALFLSGFFEERGTKFGLSPRYFAALGISAYEELSVRWFRRSPLADVYEELSTYFPRLQASLREVRGACDQGTQDTAMEIRDLLQSPPRGSSGGILGSFPSKSAK